MNKSQFLLSTAFTCPFQTASSVNTLLQLYSTQCSEQQWILVNAQLIHVYLRILCLRIPRKARLHSICLMSCRTRCKLNVSRDTSHFSRSSWLDIFALQTHSALRTNARKPKLQRIDQECIELDSYNSQDAWETKDLLSELTLNKALM